MQKFSELPVCRNYMNLDKHSKFSKEHYIGNNSLNLIEDVCNSSFEDFIKRNNINEVTEDTYRFYLDNNFNDYAHTLHYGRWYSAYQFWLNENLSKSYSSKEFISKLNSIFEIKNVEFVNPKEDITQFKIYLSKKDYEMAFNSLEFTNLRHQYNYYWKSAIDDEYSIILEPYKSKDVTNYIYDNCKGIIYTITSVEIYDKINNSKEITKHILKPNKKNSNEIFRDGRIYFICSENLDKIKGQLNQIGRLKQLKFPVILKIDLNKYRHHLIFRQDSSAFGYDAYFTEEPIPSYCIEVFDMHMKEYNTVELKNIIKNAKEFRKNN